MQVKEKEQIKKINKGRYITLWGFFIALAVLGIAYATTVSENTSTYTGDIDLENNQLFNASNVAFASTLNQGLTAYLGFDENGLASLTNVSYNAIRVNPNGRALNGSANCNMTLGDVSCPTWTTGINYYGMRFNNGNGAQAMNIENSAGEVYGSNKNISVSFWFRVDGVGESSPNLFAHSATGTPGNRIRAFLTGTGYDTNGANLTLQGAGTSETNISTENLIYPNIWYNPVIIYEFNQSATYYLNGRKWITEASTSDGALVDFSLGANDGSGQNAFNGTIDEFRIYNRLLTQEEVEALYLGGGGSSTGHLAMR
jgi:hypothetical protein